MTERRTPPEITAADWAQHRERLEAILMGLIDGLADNDLDHVNVMLIQGPDKSDPADTYWILRIDVGDEAVAFRFRPEDVEIHRFVPTTKED